MKKIMHKALILFLFIGITTIDINTYTVYAAQSDIVSDKSSETEKVSETEEVSASVKQQKPGQDSDTGEKPTQDNNKAEPKEKTEETSELKSGILDAIFHSDDINVEKANELVPEIPETPYQKYFTFETTRAMKGIVSTNSFYFYIPDYWDTKFVYVGIAYEVSRLINDQVPATLTFLVNDLPVYSCSIEHGKGEEQNVFFTIPVEKLKEGYNSLEISSYVKVYDSEGCSEDQSWSNWVNIDANSFVYAGYDLVDNNNQISYYPYPFISTVNPTGKNTGIIIPDQASNGEIAAAMYLMADISTDTTDFNEISVCQYKNIARKGITRKILVSTSDHLPQEMKKYLQIDPASTDPSAQSYPLDQRTMVRYVEDGTGNPLLLIVADKEENLMEAVHMLMDEERVSQEKVSLTFVQEGSARLISDSRKLSQLVAGSYDIEDIMGKGMLYVGPFHSDQFIYLPFGKDYVLSTDGKISLKFRYSENLDFNRSLITVYWGDVPVASKKLSKQNAFADELTFTMPADVIGTSAASIRISFDLEIKDLFCSIRQDQMPWAYITSDSTLFLPSRKNNVLSFNYFPSPIQKDGNFDNVMLIVEDELGDEELELLGKTIAVYGYQVAPYGSLKVIRANEFTESDADYNIISVGTLSNPFLSKMNHYLHFKLNDVGDAFQSNEKLVLSPQYAKNIASFQLLESPFVKKRAIVIVGSTGIESTKLALKFLQNNTDRWKLQGDCVLIDPDFELKSFVFLDEMESQDKPSIEEFVKDNKQTLIFTIMSASAMIMLLTVSVLILSRAKQYKRKEDDET